MCNCILFVCRGSHLRVYTESWKRLWIQTFKQCGNYKDFGEFGRWIGHSFHYDMNMSLLGSGVECLEMNSSPKDSYTEDLVFLVV